MSIIEMYTLPVIMLPGIGYITAAGIILVPLGIWGVWCGCVKLQEKYGV